MNLLLSLIFVLQIGILGLLIYSITKNTNHKVPEQYPIQEEPKKNVEFILPL